MFKLLDISTTIMLTLILFATMAFVMDLLEFKWVLVLALMWIWIDMLIIMWGRE